LLLALGTKGLAQHSTGTSPIAAQGLGNPRTRSVRITSSEVTDPDVAVSPDGKWMVITALGHLFRLSTAGGPTQQLTSGPYYDGNVTRSLVRTISEPSYMAKFLD
jgi:hypothetical protein